MLDEPAGPRLGELLTQRRRLPAGEGVTIVIGAARAVAALHAAGFCGVSLSDDELRFDELGTPMVLGLDRAREIVSAGAQGPADDWREVAALADRLGLVAHGRAAGALGPAQLGLGLALATLTAGETAQSLDRLETALFELAEPQAVQLAGSAETVRERVMPPLAERRSAAAHRRPSGSALIEAFDAGPAALIAGPLGEVRARVAGLAGRLHGRGRLLLVAGAAAAVLTVAAVVLMPSGAPRDPDPVSVATAPAVAGTTARATPTPTGGPVLSGDDPVAAASVLLGQRDGCLALSTAEKAGCLARVADGQASALDLPARPLAGLAPSLLERTGDSALIALTPETPGTAPASALLMRTEAGWRLRQLYEN
ncbi:hypothetical protein GCM10022287_12400 [Gryllotalpicola koreensis]|uniref:Uncharacterized protein n=1 Tax=Gryllotalpicola koreensis TaxID=993086 RepID=A0ABP7ZWD1_9MICO